MAGDWALVLASHAPGQAVRACPGCGRPQVDTGDGIWAHAMSVKSESIAYCRLQWPKVASRL